MARRDDDSKNWGGRREGAGRKAPPIKKKTVSICLPVNILEIAQGVAKKREIPFSSLVEQALFSFINASLQTSPKTEARQ